MKAARLNQPQGPVTIDEIDEPRPGPGEVLVAVEACGLCHSDVFIRGLPKLPKVPLTLGHEVIGKIKELGPDVDGFAPGDRVGITYLHSSCDACEYCLGGAPQLCPRQANTGYHVDGGFAELVVARASGLARVPAGLDAAQAAPLCCAGWTAYHAVEVAAPAPQTWLAVYGIGGLGHLAIQFAKLRGARVAAVDIHGEKLNMAAELGADLLIDSSIEEPRKALKQIGGAHAAVSFAASAEAASQAVAGLRRGGKLVLVGLANQDLKISLVDTVVKGLRIEGSFLGLPHELETVFGLAADGKIRLESTACRLDELPRAMDEMAAGRLAGRMVVNSF